MITVDRNSMRLEDVLKNIVMEKILSDIFAD
jgi:hypothetical protein